MLAEAISTSSGSSNSSPASSYEEAEDELNQYDPEQPPVADVGIASLSASSASVTSKKKITMNGEAKSRWSKLGLSISRYVNPIFLKSVTLCFVAEWGDRSQIATIALAASKVPVPLV